MFKRDFLKTCLSLPLLSFLTGSKSPKELVSPLCGKSIGKPLNLVYSSSYGIEDLFEGRLLSPTIRYVTFPVLSEVTIEYENGTESYSAYNLDNEAIAKLTIESFLNSKFEPKISGDRKMGITLLYRNYKFVLYNVTKKYEAKDFLLENNQYI